MITVLEYSIHSSAVVNLLKSNGLNLEHDIDGQNYIFTNAHYILQYVTPHSGNDYKHVLMGNSLPTFERWSVCDYEYELSNSFPLYDQVLEFLNQIVEGEENTRYEID